jgi:hypothetical protein
MTTMRGLDGNTAAALLRRWAVEALERHSREDTLPTSLRHLFYEAVMAGVVAKGDSTRQTRGRRPDQNLTDAVTWLREHGYVPWSVIEDRTRHLTDHRGDGDTIRDGVDEVLDNIRVDPWGDVLPILVAESESAAGVLVRTAFDRRTVIVPTRGQSNGWLRTFVHDQIDRPVAVGYVGDADKAGGDIEANTHRVLDEVLDIKEWERIALTWKQVETHGLPTVPRTDGRNQLTYEVCEVEALPQRILVTLAVDFLDGWLPDGVAWHDVHEREKGQRDEIRQLLNPLEAPA